MKNAVQLDFLIQSLVKTSRLETGTFQMTSLPGNLDTMIAAAIEQILPYMLTLQKSYTKNL